MNRIESRRLSQGFVTVSNMTEVSRQTVKTFIQHERRSNSSISFAGNRAGFVLLALMRELMLIGVFVGIVVAILFNLKGFARPQAAKVDPNAPNVVTKPVQHLGYDADRNALFVKSWNEALEEVALDNRESQSLDTPVSFLSFDTSERNSTIIMLSQWIEDRRVKQGVQIVRQNELIVEEEFLPERCKLGDVRISADGHLALFVGHDGQIVGWNISRDDDVERWENQLETTARTNSLSPDGTRLFVISNQGISSMRDPRTGKVLFELPKINGSTHQVTWSGDSKCVATAGRDGSIYVLDADTGNELWKMHDDLMFARILKFSPNGEYLAFGGFDKLIRVWNRARQRDKPWILAGSSGQIGDIVFTESGKKLVAGSMDGTIREWSMNTREVTRQIR